MRDEAVHPASHIDVADWRGFIDDLSNEQIQMKVMAACGSCGAAEVVKDLVKVCYFSVELKESPAIRK